MRTTILRSLQVLASISAVVMLTGANDAGCGFGSSGGDGSGGASTSGSGGTGGASVECAPDEIPTWVCSEPGGGGTTTPPDPGTPTDPSTPPSSGCNEPPPGDCFLQCIPAANYCPAGYHAETVCSDVPPPPEPIDPNTPPPPPPGGGMGSSDPGVPPDPGTCSTVCVPDDMCPPGTVQQTVCSGGGSTGSGGMGGAEPYPVDEVCWNECVPVDPPCPPGQHQVVECPPDDSMGAPCTVSCQPNILPF